MAGKKKGYGQFCPVAQASEIFAERWTPLVLRELFAGSRRFNDIRRGVPLMSPTLLSRRLKELEDAGVVQRLSGPGEKGTEYHLTAAGAELRPIIEGLGVWGAQWANRKLRSEELDPSLLMWDIRRRVDLTAVPEGQRTVVQFDLSGAPRSQSRWWLVVTGRDVDLCLKDPGYEADLYVQSHLRILTDVWIGRLPLQQARQSGALQLGGSGEQIRAFRRWFLLSTFAPYREGG